MADKIENLHKRLAGTLQDGDDAALARVLSEARAADLAESFDLLTDEDRSRIMFALPPGTAAEVVVLLDEAVRGDVIEELDTRSLTEIVSELPPDDAADMLGEMREDEAAQILGQMEAEQSEKIEGLLEYGETTAGGIMTPDVVAVSESNTVADAVECVRRASPDEDLNEVFIVDYNRKLLGTVPLRRLVTSPAATKLADICDRDHVAVYAQDDQETVVQIIRKYDAMEAAVIDTEGRLVGRITHDDLFDVAEEEAAEDLYRMAGTDPAEFETSSVFHAARIRLTWLLPCMAGMLLTATVLNQSRPGFELALFAALMLFVPMIGATGGNCGIQISTVIVRGFATGELASTKVIRALAREGRIALAMAPVCGVAAWALVSLVFPLFQQYAGDSDLSPDPGRVALAVGAGMTAAVLMAALLGIALPFTFRKLGFDPAIASGPLVTTVNDVVSVAMYMTLAMWLAQ